MPEMATRNTLDSSMRSSFSNKKIGLSSFNIHRVIGKGSFGMVYLVQEKTSKEYFAMKALEKERQ